MTSKVIKLNGATLCVPLNCQTAAVKLSPAPATMSKMAMSGVASRVNRLEKTVPVLLL